MFTGLIENTSTVLSNINKNLTVKRPEKWDDIKIGDSVAIDGVCLTVTFLDNTLMKFEYSKETKKTTGISSLKNKSLVNLERALMANQRLDGHIVQGHVDTTARIKYLRKLSKFYEIMLLLDNTGTIVDKGSIALNGVSLTVNSVQGRLVRISVIPETLKRTNINKLRTGSIVNIEFDILGKYIGSLVSGKK